MPAVSPSAEKTVPTSIKLPAALKAQIDDTARKAGLSAHAFMIKTLSEATERARLREQFTQDSLEALREMKETGLGHNFEDVRSYFDALAAYRRGDGPKPKRPVPTKVM